MDFNNSAKIISENEVVDYTESLENVYENIVLNYWDGRTETIVVEYGTEVSELPVLSEQCEFGGWYSDSELTKPFEPFTAGEEGHSSVYYADIHHTFNKNGKWKLLLQQLNCQIKMIILFTKMKQNCRLFQLINSRTFLT